MPLLPLVLPPGLPQMLPEASQHLQQQGQGQQAQQLLFSPFGGMMLPPSVVAPGKPL